MKTKISVCIIILGLVMTALPIASAKYQDNFGTTKLEKYTNWVQGSKDSRIQRVSVKC
jgi:hypothetical protein